MKKKRYMNEKEKWWPPNLAVNIMKLVLDSLQVCLKFFYFRMIYYTSLTLLLLMFFFEASIPLLTCIRRIISFRA